MPFILALAFFLIPCPAAWSADVELPPAVDVNDPAALQEATRVLAEEIKLASKPQVYLVLDLAERHLSVKGRGIALHRIPITSWSGTSPESMVGTFRLTARPPVVRRKIDPAATGEQEPISLLDMPTQFRLSWTPPLTIDVLPQPEDRSLRSLRQYAILWWHGLRQRIGRLLHRHEEASTPQIQLVLRESEAQSLAWALVDGAPLVIRRTTD